MMKKIDTAWSVLFLGLAIAVFPASVYAQVSAGGKVAASDVPSVFQVFGTVDATMTFPQFNVDSQMNVTPEYVGVSGRVVKVAAALEDKINNNGEDIATAQTEETAAGVAPSDLASAVDVIQHPENYTKEKSFSEKTIMQSGSGFAIDENGYIVTNAHVVDISNDDVQQTLSDDYVNGSGTDNLFSSLGVDPSSDNGQTLTDNLSSYLDQYATVSSSTISYKILPPSVARSMSDDDVMNDGWNAALVYKGEAYPGKDVALLKLSLNYKIPALNLSPVDPNVGDSVYVIGFPGAANLTEEVENQATFTAGTVSAVRKSDTGDFSVFQTDASSGEGSSGGPVLNTAGDVVGVLTLGSETSGGGNFNYFLPVSLVTEMLSDANVVLNPSRSVTDAYRAGVALLESGNCAAGKAAVTNLQGSLDSDFVNQLIALCAPAANASRVQPNLWWIGLLALVIIAAAMLSRRHHRWLLEQKNKAKSGS